MALETKVTGQKYRVWDAVSSVWKRLSFWTKASDVEFDSGNTLQTRRIENLKGINLSTYNKNMLVYEIGDVVYVYGRAVDDNGNCGLDIIVPEPKLPDNALPSDGTITWNITDNVSIVKKGELSHIIGANDGSPVNFFYIRNNS